MKLAQEEVTLKLEEQLYPNESALQLKKQLIIPPFEDATLLEQQLATDRLEFQPQYDEKDVNKKNYGTNSCELREREKRKSENEEQRISTKNRLYSNSVKNQFIKKY